MTEEEQIEEQYYEYINENANINPNDKITYPPVALSCGSFKLDTSKGTETYPIPIGTFGNISFIQAPPKTMKTYFLSLLASVFLNNKTRGKGSIRGHRENKKVLHVDTEQGRFHAQRVFKRVSQMSKDKDNYYTYALRQYSPKDRLAWIGWKLKQESEIGLFLLDGVADLVNDVNNIAECNNVVQKLMEWSEIYNVHILTIIHSNYGSEKPTGWLGSSLEKKAETQMILEASGDGTIVRCRRSRGYPFKPFTFSVKNDTPYVVGNYENNLEL
jgi:hypothetical protein